MKVLFLPKYSALGASSRYRIYQYLDHFRQLGMVCHVKPLLGPWYLDALYHQQTIPWMEVARSALRRMVHLAKAGRYDVLVLQYEAFPWLPTAIEDLLTLTRDRLIVDYDDAIYVNYDSSERVLVRALLRDKIGHTMRKARAVTVANANLASYAQQFNSSTHLVPTVVDLARYPECKDYVTRSGDPVIAWIGTPHTLRYLQTIREPLRDLARQVAFTLKIIGGGPTEIAGVATACVPWSEATEVEELLSCDIGVMPLPNAAVTRGKSGLKAIQYMACGLATVVSPVGENCRIIVNEHNGLHAATPGEWVTQLARLIEDRDLCRALGVAARRTVEHSYCLQVTAPRFADVITQVADA